jgi:hypothetical protein
MSERKERERAALKEAAQRSSAAAGAEARAERLRRRNAARE